MNYAKHVANRAFAILIYDYIIGFKACAQLIQRIPDALFHIRQRIARTADQPMAQCRPIRRQHKDADGVRAAAVYLRAALHVNFQNGAAAGFQRALNRLARGAVTVAVHLGPLIKCIVLDHLIKFFIADVVIGYALRLACAHLARGARDGQKQRRIFFQRHCHQRALAYARRAGYRKQLAFHSSSSIAESASFESSRCATVSGCTAQSITCSLSVMITARVRRP